MSGDGWQADFRDRVAVGAAVLGGLAALIGLGVWVYWSIWG
jgi:hypothetical protein